MLHQTDPHVSVDHREYVDQARWDCVHEAYHDGGIQWFVIVCDSLVAIPNPSCLLTLNETCFLWLMRRFNELIGVTNCMGRREE